MASMDDWADITTIASQYEVQLNLCTNKQRHRVAHWQDSSIEREWVDGPPPKEE